MKKKFKPSESLSSTICGNCGKLENTTLSYNEVTPAGQTSTIRVCRPCYRDLVNAYIKH